MIEKPITGLVMFEDENVVAVATGIRIRSTNEKTGKMIQLWILAKKENPSRARKTGVDEAVCGDCKFRLRNGGGCYVNMKGPTSVYLAWARGVYPTFVESDHAHYFRNRKIRLGAYGDPSVISLSVLDMLSKYATMTGYTHMWKRDYVRPYQKYLMASADSVEEMSEAQGMGWRTFRVRHPQDSLQPSEIACPASIEEKHRRQCETCMACNGGTPPRRSISIIAHGYAYKMASAKLGPKITSVRPKPRRHLPMLQATEELFFAMTHALKEDKVRDENARRRRKKQKPLDIKLDEREPKKLYTGLPIEKLVIIVEGIANVQSLSRISRLAKAYIPSIMKVRQILGEQAHRLMAEYGICSHTSPWASMYDDSWDDKHVFNKPANEDNLNDAVAIATAYGTFVFDHTDRGHSSAMVHLQCTDHLWTTEELVSKLLSMHGQRAWSKRET